MNTNYQIITDNKAIDFIQDLDKVRRSRVDRIYDLFEIYGTLLPGKYLKKIAKNVWELRPGDVRLFLTLKGNTGIIVHGILKKNTENAKTRFEFGDEKNKGVNLK